MCSNALHSQSVAKTHESSLFHRKNGGSPEDTLGRSTLVSCKNYRETHSNPYFSIGKTEVTRRSDCKAGPYWAPKSTLWALSSFKIVYESKQFQPHSGQRAVLRCFNALHSQSVYTTHESSLFHRKNGGTVEVPLARSTLVSCKNYRDSHSKC